MSKLTNMVKVADLRNKILFTLFIILLYRIGSHVTSPGVNFNTVQALNAGASEGGVLGYLRLFSGGALTQLAVFALGIMPYITASIIVQLMQVVIPKLEQWREEGATGQKKITQATRYLALVLAVMQATGIAFAMRQIETLPKEENDKLFGLPGGTKMLTDFDAGTIFLFVLTVTAGTVLVMWLGELITQRGIGQGMSIIIFSNVVSEMPGQGGALFKEVGGFKFGIVLAVTLLLLVVIVIIEQGQRRIPVQFAKRVVGRKMYGGQNSYIPLKVNQAGIVPIIFASAVLNFPTLIAQVVHVKFIQDVINDHLLDPTDPFYLIAYGLLIVGFAYFYTAIAFDPHQQAEVIKNQGGYIPGVRPGRDTESYLQRILNRITLPGALFVAFIALMPSIALAMLNATQYPFAGTTILIAVGVALETMKQIDSQLTLRNYEGFLK